VSTNILWWLYRTPTDTLEVLYDEAISDMIMYMEEATDRLLLSDADTKLAPAELGWRGNLLALYTYASLACVEMRVNRCDDLGKFWVFANQGKKIAEEGTLFEQPPWYEDEDLIKSHWSTGVRTKAIIPDYAIPYQGVDEYWPMLWPVADPAGGYKLMVNKRDRTAMACDDLWLPDDVIKRVANI
jgi:hypothetical protein